MYKHIENEFIKKSYYRKTELFILLISVFVVVTYLFGSKYTYNNIILQIVLSIVILIINILLFYLYIFFSLKRCKKDEKRNIFRFCQNISEYKKYIHDEDLVNFAIILEKNEINNSKKLEDVLKHYRVKISRNIKKSSDLFAFVSLIISLIALFSTDYFTTNILNVGYAIAFIIIALMLYWAISSIKSMMSLMFGRDELYSRIETTLSEIYIKDLIKK